MEKPPTQGVGVQGIASAKQGISQPVQIDWQHITGLPSFQLYAVETLEGRLISNVDEWMPDFLRIRLAQMGADLLLHDYCLWHEAKGSWPNETPFGALKSS